MTTDELSIIDKKIDELSNDKTQYSFNTLKEKVKEILKNVDIFLVDGETDSKAVDLYLKSVITKRNEIQKLEEKNKIDNSQQTKYNLIEKICKKYNFETKEELIKKVEELEKKTNIELNEIYNSI